MQSRRGSGESLLHPCTPGPDVPEGRAEARQCPGHSTPHTAVTRTRFVSTAIASHELQCKIAPDSGVKGLGVKLPQLLRFLLRNSGMEKSPGESDPVLQTTSLPSTVLPSFPLPRKHERRQPLT